MKTYIRVFVIMGLILMNFRVNAQDTAFTRDQLIEDTRQLVQMIESAHPDPYINGGGKIEFHRQFQSILQAITGQGMTLEEYIWLLQPFVFLSNKEFPSAGKRKIKSFSRFPYFYLPFYIRCSGVPAE